MQYIFERAYGNYLGLSRLGSFVAQEVGLKLEQMNCVAAIARLGDFPKYRLSGLKAKVQDIVAEETNSGVGAQTIRAGA